MLSLIWRSNARRDLRDITTYIAERNPAAAQRLRDTIHHAVERLPDHPYAHRSGRVPGTREALVHPNYILVYQVAEAIEILAIVHARQQYP
jgi:toxin ParE1/3/4